MSELTAERLDELERLAFRACMPCACTPDVTGSCCMARSELAIRHGLAEEVGALVAAARERDELAATVRRVYAALLAPDHLDDLEAHVRGERLNAGVCVEMRLRATEAAFADSRAWIGAAEKERDELRKRVEELDLDVHALRSSSELRSYGRGHEDGARKGREDERRDVVESGRKFAEGLRVSRPALETFLRLVERGEHVAGERK